MIFTLKEIVSCGLSGPAHASALSPLYRKLLEVMSNKLDRVIDMVVRDTKLSALTSPPQPINIRLTRRLTRQPDGSTVDCSRVSQEHLPVTRKDDCVG